MKKIIAIAALSAALTTPAFAGNNAYLTADLSSASYTNMGQFKNPGKIGFGAGYQFTPNVAAEAGYHMFGDSTLVQGALSQTVKVSSFTVAAVGSYPINNQFSAIGKLGMAMNKLDYTGNFVGGTGNDSKNSLYFAVGGQYNINQQFAVRVQYENFGDVTSKGGAGTTAQVAASAFGIAGVINF